MAELARPPGLPQPIEGILNLAGCAIPVCRLDRLFHLPEQRLSLYSMLVVLHHFNGERCAVLVDRVNEVASIPAAHFLPLEPEESFNGCAQAAVPFRKEIVHLLSPQRLLVEKEHQSLVSFRELEQRRLNQWEAANP